MTSVLAFLANWKTFAAGAGAILTAGGNLLTHLAAGDTSTIPHDLPIILVGLGLVSAKDWNVHK